MASIPNTRAAPTPVPTGKPPAAPTDPAAFARQFAETPEELVRIAASILSGGGEAPAPDGNEAEGGDGATADPADAPSDAAQLAALAPLLQSLPAVVAAPVAAPAIMAAPAPATPPKIETTSAKTPATTAPLPTAAPTLAPAPIPAGRLKQVKAQAQTDDAGADTGSEEPAAALDAAAKEAISAARRVIEASLRAAGPALAEAAPKAVRAVASALHTVTDALPRALAAETRAAIDDIAASTALAAPAAAAPSPSAAAQPREVAGPTADRALDLANDAEWLDRLARDIAQAAGNEGTIRFRLHPQTLGHLRVELSQGDHGTSIRLTADTEQARAILADAQPRLVAEARAQGVRIAESHVDLSGSDRHLSDDPRRQDGARQTPLIRTARDAAAGEAAPERPGRSRSDRYA
jgi:flagellar hook-length control protein FliK